MSKEFTEFPNILRLNDYSNYEYLDNILFEKENIEEASCEKLLVENLDLSPVLIVPGIGGSVIEYSTNDADKWSSMWLSLSALLPKFFLTSSAWKKNMTVKYNKDTLDFENTQNIRTRVPKFGSTYAIDTLLRMNYSEVWLAYYFHHFIEFLKSLGYVDMQTMFAAPYDFRLIGGFRYQKCFMADFKQLCETSFSRNQKKIFIIGHSLGCVITYKFLTEFVSQDWINMYIDGFISVAGPYGGAPKSLRAILSGDRFDLPNTNHYYRDIQAMMSGLLLMIPSVNIFSTPLISYDRVLYDTSDQNINQLFETFKLPDSYDAYMAIKTALSDENPAIRTYIVKPVDKGKKDGTESFYRYSRYSRRSSIFGEQYIYEQMKDSDFIKNRNYKELYGDGTVPWLSLSVPELTWKNQGVINVMEFQNTTHRSVLDSLEFMTYVKSIISKKVE